MKDGLLRAFLPSSRLRNAMALFLLANVVGTTGYMVLAGLSFLDALYQTVTTLTTVGFRELKPFDASEKLFTIFLIIFGVGTALYTLTLIIAEALEGDIRGRFYLRRQKVHIDELNDHYILCGFGRVGQEIAREFNERGVGFVVIEQNHDEVEKARAFGYLVVEGDAAEDRTLVLAGVTRARVLLAASDSDAGNTFITLTAKAVNPRLYLVARCGFPHNEEKLRLAGADRVISLYSLGGRRMVLSALQPLAADFMDTLAAGRHGDLVLAEFEVNVANGLAGRTCAELIADARNANLLGIRHRQGTLVVGPRNEDVLHDGDIVIVLAEEDDIARLTGGLAVR